MIPPPFFAYVEFLLVQNFARLRYQSFFTQPKSPTDFAKRYSFNELAAERYLHALSHYGLLTESSSKFSINDRYERVTDQDEIFSEYVKFQKPIEAHSQSWVYEVDGPELAAFNKFARKFDENVYWSLKYQVLVMNQFFQDAIIEAGLRSGRSQTKLALGINQEQIFENYALNPALLETYAEGFAHGALSNNLELAKHMSFLGEVEYLDIGGGNGSQAPAVRAANPQIRSISVLDLPEASVALKASRERWMKHFGHSANWLSDNFFSEKFGEGKLSSQRYDSVTLSWILHDWTDEQCVEILRRAKTLLTEQGQILIIEKLKRGTNVANVQDFLMMIMADGYERTLEEYSRLFATCGLKVALVIEPSVGRGIMVVKPT